MKLKTQWVPIVLITLLQALRTLVLKTQLRVFSAIFMTLEILILIRNTGQQSTTRRLPPVVKIETTKICKQFCNSRMTKSGLPLIRKQRKIPQPFTLVSPRISDWGIPLFIYSVSLDRPYKRACEIPYQIYHRFYKGEYSDYKSE